MVHRPRDQQKIIIKIRTLYQHHSNTSHAKIKLYLNELVCVLSEVEDIKSDWNFLQQKKYTIFRQFFTYVRMFFIVI